MKRLLIALLFLSSLCNAQTTVSKVWAVPGGKVNVIIQYKTTQAAAVANPMPVIIAYPGKGEFGSNAAMLYNNTPLNFAKAGTFTPNMIVVAVQVPDACCPGTWQLAATVIDSLYKGNYGIDWNKMYMTGLSYGAATVMNYIQQTPDAQFKKPAAVAIMSINMSPLCGDHYKKTDSLCGNDNRFAAIPNWCFCGTSDAFFEFQSRYVALETAKKFPVKYTTANEGHGPWLQWLDPKFGLYDWFLTYSNTTVVANKPPVAVLTPVPATITLPVSTAKLDCSGSYDPDGSIQGCSIAYTSGPAIGVAVTNGTITGMTVPGVYVFTSTVVDNKGASNTAKTSITVNPAPKKIVLQKTLTVYDDGSYTIQ